MLETKTFTSATSSASIRCTTSITLSWTRSATSRRTDVASTVRKTSRWIFRSGSSSTRTPRWAVSRLIQSPKCRALASSSAVTPSTSRAAMPAMLAMTSLATRTLPAGSACSITWILEPLDVVAGAGVHADPVSLVHEQRDGHGGSRLDPGGFRRARDRVAAHAGLCLGDLEVHGQRQLDADHRVLVPEQGDGAARLQEREHVLDLPARQRGLLVRRGVHEVVEVALVVQVAGLRLLDPDSLELLAAAKALLEDRPVPDVAQLGLDDGAGAGELDVLDGHDAEQLAVHLEGRAHSEVIRLDQPGTPLPSDSRAA